MQLQNVTLFCFFASYVAALALEALQLLKKLRINRWAALVFAGAGLIAQTAYLFFRSQAVDLPPLLTSGHDWLLVLAWLAVALYIGVELWNRELALGIFVLPAVLVLIGTAGSSAMCRIRSSVRSTGWDWSTHRCWFSGLRAHSSRSS